MDGKSRIDTLNNIKIFAGNANPDLAKKVCEYISVPLGNAIVGRITTIASFATIPLILQTDNYM